MTWWNHVDHLLVLAGLAVIISGLVAIVDASYVLSQAGEALFHDSSWPSVLPLIVFGVITAIAWTSSLRATFRIARLEAGYFMA